MKRILTAILCAALLAAGCSKNIDPETTARPAGTESAPTDSVETAAPAPTPTAATVTELTNGKVTVSIPAGWTGKLREPSAESGGRTEGNAVSAEQDGCAGNFVSVQAFSTYLGNLTRLEGYSLRKTTYPEDYRSHGGRYTWRVAVSEDSNFKFVATYLVCDELELEVCIKSLDEYARIDLETAAVREFIDSIRIG